VAAAVPDTFPSPGSSFHPGKPASPVAAAEAAAAAAAVVAVVPP
jgi:hypothetical protein